MKIEVKTLSKSIHHFQSDSTRIQSEAKNDETEAE